MAGSSGASLDNKDGTISPSSSATATSGDVSSGGKQFAGINVGVPNSGFSLSPQTILIGVAVVAGYIWAKKKKYL